jgi:hypothetical protein
VNERKVDGRTALVFHYRIAHQDVPRWELHVHDKVVAPPYDGKLWIDKKTGTLVRLDVATHELPTDFPLSAAELQIDYGDVPFGDGTSFLLPLLSVVNSSGVAGQQSRNVLRFRNCHKFRAMAHIVPSDY